jgi:hypothetical protein
LALVLVPVAAILGRTGGPYDPGPIAEGEVPMRIDSYVTSSWFGPDSFVDPGSGRPVVATLPRGGDLRFAAWAPWRDGRGRTSVVGLWLGSSRNDGSAGEQYLVRISEPDGFLIDRIPVEGLPSWSGAPCWSPDRPGRLLLSGGDGGLYRLDFDEPGRPSPRPRPLAMPGGGPRIAKLRDLTWPRDQPSDGPTILASVCPGDDKPGAGLPDEWSISWLRLNPDCSTVVALGPLIREASRTASVEDVRFPVLSTAGGTRRLAWLDRARGRGDSWRLRVATVDVDPASGGPSVNAEEARTLAEGAAAVAPAFSADGRWIVYVSPSTSPDPLRVRRLPVPGPGDLDATARALPRPASRGDLASRTPLHGGPPAARAGSLP